MAEADQQIHVMVVSERRERSGRGRTPLSGGTAAVAPIRRRSSLRERVSIRAECFRRFPEVVQRFGEQSDTRLRVPSGPLPGQGAGSVGIQCAELRAASGSSGRSALNLSDLRRSDPRVERSLRRQNGRRSDLYGTRTARRDEGHAVLEEEEGIAA